MHLPLSSRMSNEEIAQSFAFVAQVLNMDKQNHFRARAYEEAGVIIHQLNFELLDRFRELQKKSPATAQDEFQQQLDALPGIGESIAAKLVTLFKTGDIPSFQKYAKNLPSGMYPLMQLYGIGAKKAYKLAKHFQLEDPKIAIDTLLTAAQAGEVRKIEGFGEKSEQELIRSLEQRHQKARIPYQDALHIAEKVKAALEKSSLVKQVTFLGSLRRGATTVGDIDLGVIAQDVHVLKEQIKDLPFVQRVLVAGDNMIRIIVDHHWQVDIKLSSADEWGSFIQHFTGSKEHNIRLREFALKKGFSLSEHGIKIKKTDQMKKFAVEADFYTFLGLKWIPPAERVGGEELEKYLI